MDYVYEKETKDERKKRLVHFWLGVEARRKGWKLPVARHPDTGVFTPDYKGTHSSWIAGWFAGAKNVS